MGEVIKYVSFYYLYLTTKFFSIMKSPKPYSTGRIVMYVPFASHYLYAGGNNTSPLPAVIVNAWEESLNYQEEGKVNLKVFTDGPTDQWCTSVPYDENKNPGTWHWPETK